ncbi:MAG: pyridoxamine 5'-phosphate oxidase family protein [Proteobacteria bacterium]|nr:pyridoxamine 5'-phosphate oxidase family protein [Pseudomonadota bacterium]
MELYDYFEKNEGRGVLASSDEKGKVNVAVYSRPHFINEKILAFIMADRLTHKNLLGNPFAAYLFLETGPGYKGKRLYLKWIGEEKNSPLIDKLRRRKDFRGERSTGARYLVYFKVEKVLPLIGNK